MQARELCFKHFYIAPYSLAFYRAHFFWDMQYIKFQFSYKNNLRDVSDPCIKSLIGIGQAVKFDL